MKPLRVLLCVFLGLFAASLVTAQTRPKGGKTAPKQQQKKAEEEMGTIEGMTLNRPNGKFLGLTLQEGKYKLTFYDEMKKPMPVNVTRATARWDNIHGPGFHRTVLNPAGDGTYLLGAMFVRGPHSFMLYLTLIRGEGDTADATETYSFRFTGTPGSGT